MQGPRRVDSSTVRQSNRSAAPPPPSRSWGKSCVSSPTMAVSRAFIRCHPRRPRRRARPRSFLRDRRASRHALASVRARGSFVTCQAPGGAVVRSVLGSTEAGKNIAKSVPARESLAHRSAPNTFGGGIPRRATNDGRRHAASVRCDGQREPVRLSEDGAGATTLRFLQRGESPVRGLPRHSNGDGAGSCASNGVERWRPLPRRRRVVFRRRGPGARIDSRWPVRGRKSFGIHPQCHGRRSTSGWPRS